MQKVVDNNEAWYRYLSKYGPNCAKGISGRNAVEDDYIFQQRRNIDYCLKCQKEALLESS